MADWGNDLTPNGAKALNSGYYYIFGGQSDDVANMQLDSISIQLRDTTVQTDTVGHT